MDIKGLIYEGIKILDADASSKEALDQKPNDLWIVFKIIINLFKIANFKAIFIY